MPDISELSITQLSAAYQDGDLAPTDTINAALDSIAAHESKLGAFELVLADRARAAAEAAGTAIRNGHRIGPFHGVPFALKDLVDVEGLVTTAGTNALADNVAASTATIARRLIAAGGILIGKTKTVEVAYGGWGTNQARGTPWNPWDGSVHRAPGGSSSGSGVAVASRMANCAVGTDTGGSVRIPACWCGISGIKVTEARLPLDGIAPLSHTLDTPGPLARTMHDAAIMFEVMDGRHPADIDRDIESASGLFEAYAAGIDGLTFGALNDAERTLIHADVLTRYDEALARIKSLGAAVITFDLPVSIDSMKEDVANIISSEGYYHHGSKYEASSNQMDNDVGARILAGRDISARDYIEAQQRRKRHAEIVAAQMKGIAAILTPTIATPPPPIDTIDQTTTPSTLTRAVNYLGYCATTTPMGLTNDGLPTGLQIMARPFDEAMAVRVASAFERDFGTIGKPAMLQG